MSTIENVEKPILSKITITYVQGMNGLASIKKEWLGLINSLDKHGYHHLFHYYQCFLEAFAEDDQSFYFFLFHENGKLIGIFPLEKKRVKHFGISLWVLEIPWSYYTPFTDVIMINTDKPLLDMLLKDLNRSKFSWAIIRSKFTLEDATLNRILTRSKFFKSIAIFYDFNDFLPKKLIDTVRVKSRKISRSTHRKKKMLKELGSLEFFVESNLIELKICFKEFLKLEAPGWKGKTKTAIKFDPKAQLFFSRIIDHFSPLDLCRIYLLKLDGIIIAAQFCIIVNKKCFYTKSAYDEKYSNMSPGVILMEKVLAHLAEENMVNQFNFVTHYDYYKQWNAVSIKKEDVYIFNKTLIGQIAALWYRSKTVLQCIASMIKKTKRVGI